jgi:hypothetical protein
MLDLDTLLREKDAYLARIGCRIVVAVEFHADRAKSFATEEYRARDRFRKRWL